MAMRKEYALICEEEARMEPDREILDLIRKYRRLESVVEDRLFALLKTGDEFPLLQITHRIKTIDSIREKLVRKPDLYPNVYELCDILGFRTICFFSSNVDLVAERIASYFRIDWSRSKDKRALIDARSFGYLSLHYICALPEEEGELSDLWFEIQIRTILQHSWAEIEHDLGYKTEIEVPREIRRSFSRAASLLETTDIIFSQIKKSLEEYKARVREDIGNNSLDKVYFDGFTLTEFTDHNNAYRKLLNEISAITGAHITEGLSHTENLLLQLSFLGIYTFEDMIKVIEEEHGLALKLARKSLQDSGLDELSSTVAFYYLFRAKLIIGKYGREMVSSFFALTMKNETSIVKNTEKIMKEREKLEVEEQGV